MRYIDITKLTPPDGWMDRARKATDAVVNGANPEDYASVWRELKSKLADLFYSKCWYCETSIERSDNAVDHFRPKASVHDAKKKHDGYRWLAFELTNFRYSCTYCNSRRKGQKKGTSGGKADRFPLIDERKRVYDVGCVDDETPLLLDPCSIMDCHLLGCRREDGHPCAVTTNATNKKRAEESIEIYHLHYEPTCKRRHKAAVRLLADVDDAKKQFLRIEDHSTENEFKATVTKIHRLIERDAEFSGDMRFLLRGERSDLHPWIQALLEE